MLKLRRLYQARTGNSRGFTLIEVLIALAILGVTSAAFLTALNTASIATIAADERTTAESLARSELEYVKSQDFSAGCPSKPWSYEASSSGDEAPSPSEPATYAPSWWTGHTLPSEYGGYSVIVTGEGYDANRDTQYDEGIWKVTVEVYRGGNANPVLTTTTYRVFI